jgi:plastocyanin
MLVGGAATATGFVASVVVLVAGMVLGGWSLRRFGEKPTGSSPRATLDERLARGSISLEEYGQRRAVLAERSPSPAGGRGPRAGVLVAVALVVTGLAASTAFAATGTRDGWGSMMGPWMMGGNRGSGGHAAAPVPGARRITVVGDEYSFRPKVLRARAGETVNLRFENRGDQFHTLTISALGFELRADGGKTVTGSLRAPASGSVAIVCAVPGHAEAGMRARLVVAAAS